MPQLRSALRHDGRVDTTGVPASSQEQSEHIMVKSKGKTANIFVWIILGLLIIGLAGFGVDGFGGQVRSIGSVGDREIRVDDYARALQQEQRATQAEHGQAVSLQDLREAGVEREILRRLVTIAALENEAIQLGISVGDEIVAREITAMGSFRGLDGSFDREAYRRALQHEGISESQFEDDIRLDIARDILQTAVLGGMRTPQTYTDTLLDYIGARRSFSLITLDSDLLEESIPAPTDSQLQDFYDENIDDYTRGQARRITYAWVTPEMIMDDVQLDEEALRDAYEDRADEFRQPERRLVERLIFDDLDAAEDAMARIDAGEADFADIVAERGMDLADTDMGDVTREALGAAAEPVFELDQPGVVGPVDTPLGPALFRMNAVLQAQETPFEQAREELREELARDRARRVVAQQLDDYEDLLAGGATLEELADETDMELGQIDYRDGMREGIAGYPDFRSAAEQVELDDFPETLSLGDGGLFALRLDEIVPPAPEPFDDVIVRVIEDWERAQIRAQLLDQAERIRDDLQAGMPIDELDVLPERFEAMTRDAFIDDAPPQLMTQVFDMEEGEVRVLSDDARAHLVALDAKLPPDEGSEDLARMRQAIADQTRQSLAQDLFTIYARSLESEAGISLDQSAIDAVHTQLR